jgi:hypothetical protein
MLLGRDDFLQKLRSAIDTGHAPADVAPYVPQIGFCSKHEFERGDSASVVGRWHQRREGNG